MHFFSAQQDWNSERLEFGGCLIITSSHHEGTIRYHLAHQAGKRSRSSRRLQIKVPSCTKFIKIIHTFSTYKISNFCCHTAILPIFLYP
jgi:hypothetical protein